MCSPSPTNCRVPPMGTFAKFKASGFGLDTNPGGVDGCSDNSDLMVRRMMRGKRVGN